MATMETSTQPVAQSPSGLPEVSQLLRGAWDLFMKKWKTLSRISIYAFILQFVISIVAMLIAGTTAAGSIYGFSSGNAAVGGSVLGVGIIVMIALFIVYALLYAWVQAAFILTYKSSESQPQVPSIITEAKQFILPMWWVSILLGLIVMIGFILIVIPGFIFLVWFSFATLIVVLEGARGMDALRKSKSYVQGRWWAVFGRLLAAWIVVGIVSGIINSIFNLFGDYVGAALSAAFTAFVAAPYGLAFMYLLYQGVKVGRQSSPVQNVGDSSKPIA